MQLYSRFTTVDLSGNKITGTLLGNYQAPSMSINMAVNRLSGPAPVSLSNPDLIVSVINGNLFGCPILLNDVTNTGTNDMSCGSKTFDTSVYTWLAVAVVIAAAIALVLCMGKSRTVLGVKSLVVNLMKASHHHISASTRDQLSGLLPLHHTRKTVKVLESVSSMSVVLLTMFIPIFMTAYIGIKLNGVANNSVYQLQYLYTVTVAFFTGVRPAVLTWIFILLSGSLVNILCVRSRPLVISSAIEINSVHRIDTNDSSDMNHLQFRDSLKKVALQFAVATLIIATAIAINYGFVAIVYFGHPSNLSAIQFAFAVLKIIFSSIVVPISSKFIHRQYRSVYSMTMKILVTIAIPTVAVLATSPHCLYYYLYPMSITDTYSSQSFGCSFSTGCAIQSINVTSSFTPPWNYSHQCGSSLLVSYLPNFIYLYAINGIIVPLVHLVITIYSSRTGSYPKVDLLVELLFGEQSPFSSIFTISSSKDVTNRPQSEVELDAVGTNTHYHNGNEVSSSSSSNSTNVISANVILKSSKGEEYGINISDRIPSTCVDITFLLTFGIACPLLAIPISFSIIINYLMLRLALGRYILIVSSAIGQTACYQKLESAFEDEWKGLSGINIIIVIIVITIFITITTITVIIIITLITTIIITTIIITIIIRFMVGHECIRRFVLGAVVYDMIGDITPAEGLIAAVMMVITCPLVFISLQWLLSYINNTNSDTNSDINTYKLRINNTIEKISLSVHTTTWECIYSILMMKEMVNSSDINGSSNRESSMTETISPLNRLRIR